MCFLFQIRATSCLPQHSVLDGLGIHLDVLLPQLPGLHRPAHHQRTLLPSNIPDTIHFRYLAIMVIVKTIREMIHHR